MGLPVINIFLGISFFATAILGSLLLARTKELSGKFLALTSYSAALWVFSNLLFQITDYIMLSAKIMYIAGIFSVANFLFFTYTFNNNSWRGKKLVFTLVPIFLFIFSLIIFFTDTIVSSVDFIDGEKTKYSFDFGVLYHAYSLFIVVSGFFAYYFLIRNYRRAKDKATRHQIIYVSAGSGFAVAIGLVFDIILPLLDIFTLLLWGPVLISFFVIFTAIMIFRHHIFDIRVISTELFVFAILIIIFIQIFTAETLWLIFLRFSYFIIVLFFSVFLLRSIYREINQREEIERLASKLSNFVSFTTHELRTPITKFKNALTMILSGDFGKISSDSRELIKETYNIANDMSHDVNTFLNLNKLEIGKLKVNKQPFDLNDIFLKATNDFKIQTKEKNIDLKFIKHESVPSVMADNFHVAHVANNLISNAIKYTPKHGRIRIFLWEDGKNKRVYATVEDTGMGVPDDVLPQLFSLYERGAREARLVASGSGIGLFLAKKLVVLNGGKIWAESAGKDKGSKFSFYLPTE